MPREVVAEGTNKQGNHYVKYDDGAFAYKNRNDEGKTEARYFNNGRGHAFYRNGAQNIKVYDNFNQGIRKVSPIKDNSQ